MLLLIKCNLACKKKINKKKKKKKPQVRKFDINITYSIITCNVKKQQVHLPQQHLLVK